MERPPSAFLYLSSAVSPNSHNEMQESGKSAFSIFFLHRRTYVIHAGSVISTDQPYRVVVTLFANAVRRSSRRLDAISAQRTLPAFVAVRLSSRGSNIAEEERECYPDSTVSVSFKVGKRFGFFFR